MSDQKLTIQSPKSGKDAEVVFVPRKVADRLRSYLKNRAVEPENRILPITYAAARIIVKNAGKLAGIQLRPHDLRGHAATYASRSVVPIGIVIKVILRHSNPSTTQRFLGKISEDDFLLSTRDTMIRASSPCLEIPLVIQIIAQWEYAF